MIDKLNERYDTIYRKALKANGPLAGRTRNRTVTDCPTFEKQAGSSAPRPGPATPPG